LIFDFALTGFMTFWEVPIIQTYEFCNVDG
jgi:hypothetical protein